MSVYILLYSSYIYSQKVKIAQLRNSNLLRLYMQLIVDPDYCNRMIVLFTSLYKNKIKNEGIRTEQNCLINF